MAAYCLAGIIGPIGTPELIIILVVALLIFGKRLPDVGKSLGKGIVEFKKGLKGVTDEVSKADREIDEAVAKSEEVERKRLETAATVPGATATTKEKAEA